MGTLGRINWFVVAALGVAMWAAWLALWGADGDAALVLAVVSVTLGVLASVRE